MKTLIFVFMVAGLVFARPVSAQELTEGGLEETDQHYTATGEVDTIGWRAGGDIPPPNRFFFRDGIDIPVFHQFKLPACVGYAIASAVAMRLNWFCRNRCGCRQKLSPFSASYIFNQIYRDGAKGISLAAGLDTLWAQGICPEHIFPNDPRSAVRRPSPADRQAAGAYRCWQQKERIFFLPDEMPDAPKRKALMLDLLRGHLSKGLPVIAGLRCPPDFFKFQGGKYTAQNLPEKANHAVVVTGYDNDKREIEILNSFGERWGAGGFARIGFDDFCEMARYGYVIRVEGGVGKYCFDGDKK